MSTIFVAECYNEQCKYSLDRIKHELTSNGFKLCESLLGGKKRPHFTRNFQSSSSSVFHYCVHLWKLINVPDIKKAIDEQSDKIFCVNFGLPQSEENLDEEDQEPEIETQCKDFFDEFIMHHVLDETQLRDFVTKTYFFRVKSKRNTESKKQEKPELFDDQRAMLPSKPFNKDMYYVSSRKIGFNSPFAEKHIIEKLRVLHSEVTNDIKDQNDTLFPNSSGKYCIFGRHVYEIDEECQLMDYSKVSSFIDIKNILNAVLRDDAKVLTNLKFLIFKVLPELTASRCIHGLTLLCTCDYLPIQTESHERLELLVFQRKTSSTHIDDQKLKMCLDLLLSYVSHISGTLNEEQVEQKCLLFVLLLGEFISRCQTDFKKCKEMNKQLMLSIPKHQKNKTLGKLKEFLTLSKKELEIVFRIMCDPPLNNPSRKLQNSDERMQFFTILQQIKQLFKSAEVSILNNLRKSIEKSKVVDRSNSSCSSFRVQLIQRGLAHYLHYMAKHLAHTDLEEICPEVLTVLQISKNKDEKTFQEVFNGLHLLIVCPVKSIRKKFLTFVNMKARYNTAVFSELVKIIEKILYPLFLIDLTTYKVRNNLRDDWPMIPGKFNGFLVFLYIRQPKFKDHSKFNKVVQLCDQDLKIMKHIRTLEKLKHDYIIKLYSYCINELPLFYIIERSKMDQCRNVQEYLLNKKSNQSFCTILELFNMLIQAAGALAYCHDNNIIHGNITLKHFILSNPACIKLTDFHMATSADKTQTTLFAAQELEALPTLYSAPESLKRSKRSQQSDVWMFACLTNSILNHGELIPCDLSLTDENIFLRILTSTYELSWPSFVTTKLMKLIKDCLFVESRKRPFMNEVYSQLDSISKDFQNGFNGTLSDFPSKHLEPLSTERTGIPKVKLLEQRHEYPTRFSISHDFKYYLKNQFHLFRSKMKHISPQLRKAVKNGALDHIVPLGRFVTKDHTRYTLEVRIPFLLSGNIIKMIRTNKAYFNTPANFNDLVVQVACIVKSLHESNFVLGEIRIDQLYLETLSNGKECKIKVHLVSLPYLSLTSANNVPLDNNFKSNIQRCSFAPEIRERQMFTFASDVYSFGFLLWDLWHARMDSQNIKEAEYKNSDLVLLMHTNKVTKPARMSQMFFDFLMLCLHQDMDKRPIMDDIISTFCILKKKSVDEKYQATSSHQNEVDELYLKEINPSSNSTTNGHAEMIQQITIENTIIEMDNESQVSALPDVSVNTIQGTSDSGLSSGDPHTDTFVISELISHTSDVLNMQSTNANTRRYELNNPYDIYGDHTLHQENNASVPQENFYDCAHLISNMDESDTDEDYFESSDDDNVYHDILQ